MTDFESKPSWLKKLSELNARIAATGEPLVGNLFYDHLQADYLTTPPNPILKVKRDRFRRAIAKRTRLLEVGVNGGHSAFLALTSDPAIEFHGVDICEHAYVKPAVQWLKQEFPGRVFFHEGDCRAILPKLVREGWKFDAFHIDGAKFTYFEDICNCQGMIADEAVVIVDDSQQDHVARVLRRCVREDRIQPASEFPPMPLSDEYRNQIGHLRPASNWQRVKFRLLSPARRLRGRTQVQRLEASLPRLVQQGTRRARALARHPVGVVRRKVFHGTVES
jgi:methyltransferase family protein